MLRRIANLLFWTARYLERAEWRARLVDVNYRLLTEIPPAPGTDAWSHLLAIIGERKNFAEHYATPDEASVLTYFTLDERNLSSIRSCIATARENCRALRNRISSELWLAINTLYLDSRVWSQAALAAGEMYGFFFELRERFYRIAGIVEATMPRDESYDFLTMGRSLEAAENVTRLLDVKYHFLLPSVADVGGALDLAQWAALLRSASALEAYRKTYGNTIRIEQVVDFLLFDQSFPRAARFTIERLEQALARVGALVPQDIARLPTVSALAERLRLGSAPTAVHTGLHEYLLAIQDDCAKISDEIFVEYLRFE